MHPRWIAALSVAFRANSAAIPPSKRLASAAPRRSRCSRGFIHGLLAVLGVAGCAAQPGPGLEVFQSPVPACYDRSAQPQTAVVDSHLHFRPFGGAPVPFDEIMRYLRETGVRFVNIYGIGQMLPVDSPCTYYLDCPGTLVIPTLKNDFANAASVLANPPVGVHATLAMTFPDLSRPDMILPEMALLDKEYPGMFRWMGEVNLVKQALFGNGHEPVPAATIAEWAPFMEVLRERDIPIAIHSDLGSDEEPTRYLSLMREVLDRYPDNKIVWMHMGLSLELKTLPATEHIEFLSTMLDRHPNLMLDITWRIVNDNYFAKVEYQPLYVDFLNEYSDRILPGTDFLASSNKTFDIYKAELEVTSRILGYLNDEAFRNIALGENYFRVLGLDYEAPRVCGAGR